MTQPSGDEQVIQIDFWDILTTGNIRKDITLRHGDAINIPIATALTPQELTQLSAANFSPDTIRVTVASNVGCQRHWFLSVLWRWSALRASSRRRFTKQRENSDLRAAMRHPP